MKRLICAAKRAAAAKLKVVYEPYDRYGSSGARTATVSGDDLLDALKKMVDHMELYISSSDIDREGWTAEEVIDKINETNDGGGCDFIYSLTDLKTKDDLIYEGEPEEMEEEWD